MHSLLKLAGGWDEIFFPYLSKHNHKHSPDTKCNYNVRSISYEAILEGVNITKLEAQDTMEKLGIAIALKRDIEWINFSHKSSYLSDDFEDEVSVDPDIKIPMILMTYPNMKIKLVYSIVKGDVISWW